MKTYLVGGAVRDELLGYDIIQMDETTVQVLREPGRDPTSKSHMWVFRGGDPRAPSFYFHQYHYIQFHIRYLS